MAKQADALIKDTRNDMLVIEQKLREFTETRDELNRKLANARRRLARKESPVYPTKLASALIASIKEAAPSLLIDAIDNAAAVSSEFRHPAYLKALYKVANDETIYKMITSGAGWQLEFRPQIVFESVAGTLADYAAGVTRYREILKIRLGTAGQKRGLHATNYWLSKVYGTSKQGTTIDGRINASGREAPFWQLLNSGGTTLASDRVDGSFNPIAQPPTDFIGKAEQSLRVEFLTKWLPEKLQWLEEEQSLIRFIEETKNTRDAISDDVSRLKVEASQNRAVFDSFGKLKKFVDSGKIEEAIRKYRAGEEFERVYISKAGAGRRLYLTARKLEGLID